MCLVFGYPIQVVQDLTHAPELIVQHLMPMVCAIDLQSIIHTLAKVRCHIYDHLQCYLVVRKGVVVQEASHNLVDLQAMTSFVMNAACPEMYNLLCCGAAMAVGMSAIVPQRGKSDCCPSHSTHHIIRSPDGL